MLKCQHFDHYKHDKYKIVGILTFISMINTSECFKARFDFFQALLKWVYISSFKNFMLSSVEPEKMFLEPWDPVLFVKDTFLFNMVFLSPKILLILIWYYFKICNSSIYIYEENFTCNQAFR